MFADRQKTHSTWRPSSCADKGRRTLSFGLPDLAELIGYLKPGASFYLAKSVCEALFPGGESSFVALSARCDAWARERHSRARACAEHDEIEFRSIGETSLAGLTSARAAAGRLCRAEDLWDAGHGSGVRWALTDAEHL
jgi:hypothetical protein